jgi:UDP-N-acetylmuramoylalanine--D-glutamate ligase
VSGRFEGRRVVVVGAGVAGSGAARALAAEGADVVVTDERPASSLPQASALLAEGIEVRAGGHSPDVLDGAALVVASPGVPPSAEVLAWAEGRRIPVWGELELGARLATAPYVGVTGTNGKTTVTAMIEGCARADGVDAVACGNIGRSFPQAAREPHDLLVVEASSFQLALQRSFRPRASVLLNLGPDHLDWHGSYEAYVAAKARIVARQTGDDVHVGNRDDVAAAAVSASAPCEVRWFRSGPPEDGEVGYEDGRLVARIDGEHRLGPAAPRPALREDAAAAAAVALSIGISPAAVAAALARFRPAAHRGAEVAVVDGVRFVDDSKATNIHAALAAIRGVDDAVLIAGGRAKGVDLMPLRAEAGRLRAVVAIGEAAPDLVEVFRGMTPTSVATSIEEAVRQAYTAAGPGGVVLLAPACASWDQFADYAERGERFAAAALALQREVPARG